MSLINYEIAKPKLKVDNSKAACWRI